MTNSISEKAKKNFSYPIRLILKALLTILLVWTLNTQLSDYVIVTGGWHGYLVIGALLTLMNLFIRPVLNILSIPVKLFATLLGIVLVNGVFLWLTTVIADELDPMIVTMQIRGGIGGWIVLAITLGLANWMMKLVLRA